MKKITFLVTIIITILGLPGCGIVNEETSPDQSNFKQNYSIGSIIEAHQELLIEGPRTLSGQEAGPPEPFIQAQEEMILQVDSSNAPSLLEAIQSDIVEALNISEATIMGSSGSDLEPDPVAYFSYSYSDGLFYGVINIWGFQGEGNTFIIISEITESKINND